MDHFCGSIAVIELALNVLLVGFFWLALTSRVDDAVLRKHQLRVFDAPTFGVVIFALQTRLGEIPNLSKGQISNPPLSNFSRAGA